MRVIPRFEKAGVDRIPLDRLGRGGADLPVDLKTGTGLIDAASDLSCGFCFSAALVAGRVSRTYAALLRLQLRETCKPGIEFDGAIDLLGKLRRRIGRDDGTACRQAIAPGG